MDGKVGKLRWGVEGGERETGEERAEVWRITGKERQGETEVLRPTSRFEITPGLAEAEVISNLEVGKSNFLDLFWKIEIQGLILVMFRERKKRRWSMSTLKSKWFCCRGSVY